MHSYITYQSVMPIKLIYPARSDSAVVKGAFEFVIFISQLTKNMSLA